MEHLNRLFIHGDASELPMQPLIPTHYQKRSLPRYESSLKEVDDEEQTEQYSMQAKFEMLLTESTTWKCSRCSRGRPIRHGDACEICSKSMKKLSDKSSWLTDCDVNGLIVQQDIRKTMQWVSQDMKNNVVLPETVPNYMCVALLVAMYRDDEKLVKDVKQWIDDITKYCSEKFDPIKRQYMRFTPGYLAHALLTFCEAMELKKRNPYPYVEEVMSKFDSFFGVIFRGDAEMWSAFFYYKTWEMALRRCMDKKTIQQCGITGKMKGDFSPQKWNGSDKAEVRILTFSVFVRSRPAFKP